VLLRREKLSRIACPVRDFIFRHAVARVCTSNEALRPLRDPEESSKLSTESCSTLHRIRTRSPLPPQAALVLVTRDRTRPCAPLLRFTMSHALMHLFSSVCHCASIYHQPGRDSRRQLFTLEVKNCTPGSELSLCKLFIPKSILLRLRASNSAPPIVAPRARPDAPDAGGPRGQR
jgi:hypothetical protein